MSPSLRSLTRLSPLVRHGLISLSVACLISLRSSSAHAQRTPSASPAEPAALSPLDTRLPNERYIDAVRTRVSHASLGYALGRHGDSFSLGVRYDQPVAAKLVLRFFHYTDLGPLYGPFDPVLRFGVELVVRSPAFFGIFRLYGGFGFFAGFRPDAVCQNPVGPADARRLRAEWATELSGQALQDEVASSLHALEERCSEQKDPFTFSGGGYSGVELFGGPVRAYFIEIGGTGGAQESGLWQDAGLILRAGNQFYF